jgi:predicted ester cyclase
MRNVQSTLLYKWFDKVWNKGDENAIDELMTNDSEAHGIIPEGQPKGAAGFKIFYKGFRNQLHDIHITVDDVVSQDDLESARTTVTAIHTQTGKAVKFSGICMVRVADGKIAEAWNNYDFLDMYQQLGLKLTHVE